VTEHHGGRAAALSTLAKANPAAYGRTRNHVDGAVTHLSPYLRHGVITLDEVRRHILATDAPHAYRLINQLSWRDFFTRVYAEIGWEIWSDLEPYKTGWPATHYLPQMPADITEARTGLACIDAWSTELHDTGWLHNHIRLWLASYVVHHRGVRWQAGARWFLTHLLDGDLAANNLSWQWVSSTWRRYPYLWNRANLVRNAGRRWCDTCPLQTSGCPFATTYPNLTHRLFPNGTQPAEAPQFDPARLKAVTTPTPATPPPTNPTRALVWIHGERLSPTNEALLAYPTSPAVFVWDDPLLTRKKYNPLRLRLMQQSLAETPATVGRGDVVAELRHAAAEHGATTIVTTPAPGPRHATFVDALTRAGLTLHTWHPTPFTDTPPTLNLWRHTPYWHAIKTAALTPNSTPEVPPGPWRDCPPNGVSGLTLRQLSAGKVGHR